MPRPEDIHIGQRIRQRRLVMGLTQQQVGEQIGVKFQQLQKYETGANRVSGSRLCDIAKALQVKPSYFFEGISVPAPCREIKSPAEISLLQHFRKSPKSARASILRIAEEAAQACAPQTH